MKISTCGAKYSSIISIGEKIKKISKETNKEFLSLNRGVNAVVNIDLNTLIKDIDFNTNMMQVYAPVTGIPELRQIINREYFHDKNDPDNISIISGSTFGLGLLFSIIDSNEFYFPEYFWGTYKQILTINNKECNTYTDLTDLIENSEKYKDKSIVICDPNNPLGNRHSDDVILKAIDALGKQNCTIIFDCPYRKLFSGRKDDLFSKIANIPNLIIIESFSKWMGLSGQRIGFIHSTSQKLNDELRIRLLYSANGVNTFAQIMVTKLLDTTKGEEILEEFTSTTKDNIKKNIDWLRNNNLLANEFYQKSSPEGIFVIVNKSQEELFSNYIGSVSLSYFTIKNKELAQKYSRICVSVPHKEFVKYFSKIIE